MDFGTTKKFGVSVDGVLTLVRDKYTVLQLCAKVDKFLPRFCYHNKLSIAANCRMCLVQLDDMPKLSVACAVSITDNLNVYTNLDIVKKARESILEFLLINHPLDCPICDQGGECDLQDQTILFGSDRGRFYEFKRAVRDINIGQVVKTFMNRCIHCTRCIRFSNEILGIYDLGLVGRGNNMRISTFILNKALKSELSGNISDICPVGALTLKAYAFKARPWELKNFVSIDVFDSFGSNIRVDVRGTEIMRVLPYYNANINEEFITDKIRLFFDGHSVQRVFSPVIQFFFKNGKSISPNLKNQFKTKPNFFGHDGNSSQDFLSWRSILFLIFRKINEWNIFLVGSQNLVGFAKTCELSNFFKINFGSTVEINVFIFLKLFHDFFSFRQVFQRQNVVLPDNFFRNLIFRSNFLFFYSLRNLNLLGKLLTIGLNLKGEAPVLNFKINRLFFKRSLTVFNISINLEATFPFFSLGVSNKTLLQWFNGRLSFCAVLVKCINDFTLPADKREQNTFNNCFVFGQGIFFRHDFVNLPQLVDFVQTITPQLKFSNIVAESSLLNFLEIYS